MHSGAGLASFGDEVRAGLGETPKTLPCRFFYDEAGSLLFEEICQLPEYYLTRAEREILEENAGEIAARFPAGTTLAELGSGSSVKTRLLIEGFLERHGELTYVPVDISRSMLEASAEALLGDYERLTIHAIAGEYEAGLRHLRADDAGTRLIAWLGSTVGNLHPPAAAEFLRRVGELMSGRDRLLIGIDLRKRRDVLEAAYDDEKGVTARFNLNLLARINRELGGGFDLTRFAHRVAYDAESGAVESYLMSRRSQSVPIAELDLTVRFAAGERIHTESSYKFSLDEIDALAERASLRVEDRWLDSKERFSLNLLARA